MQKIVLNEIIHSTLISKRYSFMAIPRIVIAGAGFGGITAARHIARRLRRTEAEIMLIDRNPYQLYTPALYEIATVPRGAAPTMALKNAMVLPLDRMLAGTGITFIHDELSGLDATTHTLSLRDAGTLPFDYLILALGSETNYFNIPGLKEHAYPLKRFEDAVRIRNRIETLLRDRDTLTIVVGGGGPSGVELVAEFENYICRIQYAVRTDRKVCRHQMVILEGSDTILRGFDPRIIALAQRRLAALGVKICTKTAITKVTETEVYPQEGGAPIPCDILIWTGGVAGLASFGNFGLPLGPKGNFPVDEFLRVRDMIFAVGDAAHFVDPRTKNPLPWNASIAEGEAYAAAENVVAAVRGKPLRPFRPARRYPYILTVGKKYAIADMIFFILPGLSGWMIKLLVELRYLMGIFSPLFALRSWWRKVMLYISND